MRDRSSGYAHPARSNPQPGIAASYPHRFPWRRDRSPRRRCSPDCAAMSAEWATYLDSSAIVKLAVEEPESAALHRYLRRRRPLVSSSLARAEVARALLPLAAAGALLPQELRTLDAIHLATAQQLGGDLHRLITYDARMRTAAETIGCTISAPS